MAQVESYGNDRRVYGEYDGLIGLIVDRAQRGRVEQRLLEVRHGRLLFFAELERDILPCQLLKRVGSPCVVLDEVPRDSHRAKKGSHFRQVLAADPVEHCFDSVAIGQPTFPGAPVTDHEELEGDQP